MSDQFTLDKKRKIRVNKQGQLVVPIINEKGEKVNWIMSKEEFAKLINETKPYSDFNKLSTTKGH